VVGIVVVGAAVVVAAAAVVAGAAVVTGEMVVAIVLIAIVVSEIVVATGGVALVVAVGDDEEAVMSVEARVIAGRVDAVDSAAAPPRPEQEVSSTATVTIARRCRRQFISATVEVSRRQPLVTTVARVAM
jgi:hypothetical protein